MELRVDRKLKIFRNRFKILIFLLNKRKLRKWDYFEQSGIRIYQFTNLRQNLTNTFTQIFQKSSKNIRKITQVSIHRVNGRERITETLFSEKG